MAGSTYGRIFQITTWGESHGKALGVVVDGCPAGLPLCEEDIQKELNRRKPGQSRFTTSRDEGDEVEILSGIFEGRTTGTPISMMVRNKTQRSADYSNIATVYRPGHADYTFDAKYGFRDYRGGGRSSGRETLGRVAAGAIAKKLLGELGVTIDAYVSAIGPVRIDRTRFQLAERDENPVRMPDSEAAARAQEYLDKLRSEKNSSGAMIECVIGGVPKGLGDPVFEKLDANLAKAMMSIGAVKGVEIGDGFEVAVMTGAEDNDAFAMVENVAVKTSNHAGGILGGISDGSDIILRLAVKPTPSIASLQHTINQSGENVDIEIHGRHDPIIAPRAVPVVEAMAAITILDALLVNMTARVDSIKGFYRD
ncbi:MAG: chorismate synthase [Lachnospiraceae bacterium]